MKIIILLVSLLFYSTGIINSQNEGNNAVKNIIILIPDGTSSSLLSLARWYNGNEPLAMDPYICGMVRTYCSDGRFPDSAPTSTAYATGVKTKAPYIGISPDVEPQISVLELARLKGLSTGIIATCEFPHATPADFVCHFNSREGRLYKNLSKQFIYNSPTLLFAGGKKFIDRNKYADLLKENNIELITTVTSFESIKNLPENGKKIWGLFPDWQDSTSSMSLECDRNPLKAPGLSQMTAKAIDILSKNEKGFFMMVEGSQVDWTAHLNDPYGAVTEFMEFNAAVKIAIDFAKKDKNTVIIVCPDHGTGGLSLGNKRSSTGYDYINIKDSITEPLHAVRFSARKLTVLMLKDSAYISKDSIFKYYNLSASDGLIKTIKRYTHLKRSRTDSIEYILGTSLSHQRYIGWTSRGHVADDVFLAIYTPENVYKKTGVIENYEIGKYMAELLELGDMNAATNSYFCKHTDKFFTQNLKMEIQGDTLMITGKNKTGTILKNTNVMKMDGKTITLPTIAVYLNNTFYIPKVIKDYFR